MNQKVKRDTRDVWLCLQCGEKIIPFEKSANAGIVEGILFFVGLAVTFLVNWMFGLILIALSVIITAIRSSGRSKVCPSCESANIVPATSPAAQKLART